VLAETRAIKAIILEQMLVLIQLQIINSPLTTESSIEGIIRMGRYEIFLFYDTSMK
jgi:hypothetical protein